MSRHVKHCQLYLPTCIEVTNTNQRQDKLRYSLIADIPVYILPKNIQHT